MGKLYNTAIFEPLYNGFILLIDTFPFFDAGIIIIIFTIIVKIIILPLSIKASKSQLELKITEPDIAEIRAKHKDKLEQNTKIMEFYKEKGINPFSGFLVLLIQLPILFALYKIFITSGLPDINSSILYGFVSLPETVNMIFLGLISISSKNWILAILAGLTTYFQVTVSLPAQQNNTTNTGMQGEIAKAMSTQTKYFLPVIMVFVAYTTSSAVALYLVTSNLFAIAQEIYIKKKYHKAIIVV